jgi:hypothetical protein
MASVEKRGEHYRIVFRYDGRKYQAAIKASSTREADALCGRLEENLMVLPAEA